MSSTLRVEKHGKMGRKGRGLVAALAVALLTVLSTVGLGSPASAAPQDITSVCATSQAGTTITLTSDCATTTTLTVPDGFTLDGGGHTITASDASLTPAGFFTGPVVTNAGTSMYIENLTVRGNFSLADETKAVFGIVFTNADGTIDGVQVLDITRHSTFNYGQGIQVIAAGTTRSVTITNTTVSGFQKAGLNASGSVIVDVSGSTIGPPDLSINTPTSPFPLAQNTAQYIFGAGGTITGSTIIGYSALQNAGGSASIAILLFGSSGVTVDSNVFGGDGTDIAIGVYSGSTGTLIQYNQIDRSAPPAGFPDVFGIGVQAQDPTTLVCNTFAGWKQNLDGAAQVPCITTTTLPDGQMDHAYSTSLAAVTENPDPSLTWSLTGGDLPPGLTLDPDGTISGIPTESGIFSFTVQVFDTVDGLSLERELTITITEVLPAPFVVQFSPNGGTGTMDPQVGNAPAPLDANTFTRPGYTFVGWNTSPDGTGTSYADGATFAFAASTTLYAIWELLPGSELPPPVGEEGSTGAGGSRLPTTGADLTTGRVLLFASLAAGTSLLLVSRRRGQQAG